jgi:hypothetical protein
MASSRELHPALRVHFLSTEVIYIINLSSYCGNPINFDMDKNLTEIGIAGFNFGFTNFDNILTSTFTIFQVLTLESWSQILLIVIELIINL